MRYRIAYCGIPLVEHCKPAVKGMTVHHREQRYFYSKDLDKGKLEEPSEKGAKDIPVSIRFTHTIKHMLLSNHKCSGNIKERRITPLPQKKMMDPDARKDQLSTIFRRRLFYIMH